MRTFQDNAGRTWTVVVTVDSIKRVRDLLGEDLLDIEHILPRLQADPILLCDIVYSICKPQADAEKISDVDFARAMAGDSIAHAKAALIEELINFFPDQKVKEVIRLAIERGDYLSQQLAELAKKRLQKMTLPPEIEAAWSAVGDSFTN
jgi:hypothetical protein